MMKEPAGHKQKISKATHPGPCTSRIAGQAPCSWSWSSRCNNGCRQVPFNSNQKLLAVNILALATSASKIPYTRESNYFLTLELYTKNVAQEATSPPPSHMGTVPTTVADHMNSTHPL